MNPKKILVAVSAISSLFYFSSCSKEAQPAAKPLYELYNNYSIPKFDGANAYKQVEAQVNFGPRNPGSNGHQEALDYFQSELKKYADEVQLQNFNYPGYDNKNLSLTNIIAKFNPEKKNRIMFCAHWDTRPRAEHAFDKADTNKPILGANDGASGCGVLLELAKILKENKINYGVDLVFFDGEDYGKENDLGRYCLGSKYYAANLPLSQAPAFCVLLDMVGDKKAAFEEEGNSIKFAPNIVNMIWGIAANINAAAFSQNDGEEIYDDHIPLIQAGFTAGDIIDAGLIGDRSKDKQRDYWHSENDTMVNISEATLQQVGDVLTNLIYSLQFNS